MLTYVGGRLVGALAQHWSRKSNVAVPDSRQSMQCRRNSMVMLFYARSLEYYGCCHSNGPREKNCPSNIGFPIRGKHQLYTCGPKTITLNHSFITLKASRKLYLVCSFFLSPSGFTLPECSTYTSPRNSQPKCP